MNVDYAQALHRNDVPVGVNDVHLPNRWLLNARRVPVPPVSRSVWERREEILHQSTVLPLDLWEHPYFEVAT
jgi:hypothetical protein